jgi:hypothetical protein
MAKDGEVAVWFQPLRLANAELLERHLYQVADTVIEARSCIDFLSNTCSMVSIAGPLRARTANNPGVQNPPFQGSKMGVYLPMIRCFIMCKR